MEAWEDLPAPRPEFRLTPVLPIVFHTGPRPWSAARTIEELIAVPKCCEYSLPSSVRCSGTWRSSRPRRLIASAAEWLQALAIIRAEGKGAKNLGVMGEVVKKWNNLAARDTVRWHDLMWSSWAGRFSDGPGEREALAALATAQENGLPSREVHAMSQTIADYCVRKTRRGTRAGQANGRP